MIAFLKRFWWLAFVLAAIIFFEWHGCHAGPDHSKDKTEMDSLNRAYTNFRTTALQQIAQLERDSAQKDSTIDVLMVEKINAQRDLAERGKHIDQTISAGQQARVARDTPRIVSNCDSLLREVIAGKAAIGGYEIITDSLIRAQFIEGSVKDSIAANWKSLFLHADTAQALERQKYNSLYGDYVKVNSRLKFDGIVQKGAALAIAALVIGLFIKK